MLKQNVEKLGYKIEPSSGKNWQNSKMWMLAFAGAYKVDDKTGD